jgi:hypothetical protein
MSSARQLLTTTTTATATRSTISISVPDDRRDDERWPPVLVRFPLGAPRDDVLRSLTSTRVSSYMGMGANANTTLQRGVVIATPAARYSGVAALPTSANTTSLLLLPRWQLAPQVNASARGRLKVVSDMSWRDTTRPPSASLSSTSVRRSRCSRISTCSSTPTTTTRTTMPRPSRRSTTWSDSVASSTSLAVGVARSKWPRRRAPSFVSAHR